MHSTPTLLLLAFISYRICYLQTDASNYDTVQRTYSRVCIWAGTNLPQALDVYKPDSRLSLLSAKPAVTFSALLGRPLAGTNLYCFIAHPRMRTTCRGSLCDPGTAGIESASSISLVYSPAFTALYAMPTSGSINDFTPLAAWHTRVL